MQTLIILAAILAVTFATDCASEYKSGFDCFIKKANDLAKDIDFDKVEECVKTSTKACASAAAPNFPGFNINPDTMLACVQEVMPKHKDSMQSCLQEQYPGFEMPQGDPKNAPPGIKLIIYGKIVQGGMSKCAGLKTCFPESFDGVKAKADLCNAKTECMKLVSSECMAEKDKIKDAACECFKTETAKTTDGKDMFDEMATCMSDAGSSVNVPPFMKNVLVQQMQKKVCETNPADIMQCDTDASASASPKGAQAKWRLGARFGKGGQ